MKINISVKNEQGQMLPSTLHIQGGGGYGDFVSAYPALTFTLDTGDMPGLTEADTVVIASSPGYNALSVSGNALQPENDFILLKSNTDVLLATGLVVGVGLLMFGNKKKGVGAVDFKKDILPYALPVGALVIGGVVVNKLFEAFGLTKDEAQTARDAALQAEIDASPAASLSDAQIATIADALHNDLGYSSVSNNTADAARQLTQVNNTTDILKLVLAYGDRYISFFGIPRGKFSLPETIIEQMADYEIAEVNNYYAAMGINFKF